MFSFRTRKHRSNVANHLRRICDRTTPNNGLTSHLDRLENRYNRTLPVLLWPWADGKVDGPSVVGATKDVTDRGIGVILTAPVTHRELVVCLLSDETAEAEPWFFRGKLVRGKSIGAGFWVFGVQLDEFLNQDEPDAVAPLRHEAERLRPTQTVPANEPADAL